LTDTGGLQKTKPKRVGFDMRPKTEVARGKEKQESLDTNLFGALKDLPHCRRTSKYGKQG